MTDSQILLSSYRQSSVLVTGASGFIGARLLRKFSFCRPRELRALVRPSSALNLIEDLDVDLRYGSLNDAESLHRACLGVDYIFHLGGLTRGRSLAELTAVNAGGTATLVAAAQAVAPQLKRLLYVSSQAAVGPCPSGVQAMNEQHEARPLTWYGASKLAGELELKNRAGALPWSILRPPGVYGPGEQDFLTMFQMIAKGFAPILGFGEKHYSFVFSEDLVDSLLAVAAAEATKGGTYFVAEPAIHSNREMAALIEESLGKKALKPTLPHAFGWLAAAAGSLIGRFSRRPPLLTLQKMRELAPRRWVVDCAALERDTGFRCSTTLAAGIEHTARWYQQQGWL